MRAGDRPEGIDQWMRKIEQQLEQLDARVRNVSPGTTARTVASGTDTNAYASFLFGRTYAAAPVVVANGWGGAKASIITITQSGFTARFEYADGSPATSTTATCSWIATPTT